MLIQIYNGAKDNTGNEIELEAALHNITNDVALQQKTAQLRKALTELQLLTKEDPDYKKNVETQENHISYLKQKLPAVTWSGTFTKRNKDLQFLKQYTQLICIDADYVNPHFKFKEKFSQDPHTHICFTSPGGRGLKIIFKVAGAADQHKEYFLSIEKYIQEKYNLQIDPSGKDVSRLCFLCHDKDLYVNRDSRVFDLLPGPADVPEAPKPLTKKEATEFEATEDFYSVMHFTDKRLTYAAGSRNNYIFLFACNCNRKGFSEAETIQFSQLQFTDQPANEIASSVKSAYQHHKHEHAKYAKKVKAPGKNIPAQAEALRAEAGDKQNKKPALPDLVPAPGNGQAGGNGTIIPHTNGHTNGHAKYPEEYVQFWNERKIVRGKGTDKQEKIEYTISRVKLVKFWYGHGFHIINTLEKGYAYQLCYSKENIIEPIVSEQIKQFTLDYCLDKNIPHIEELVREKTSIFELKELNGLYRKVIKTKKDTIKESYFYFKNCWVTVTAEGVTTHDYKELGDYYIWAGNKIDHDFVLEESFMNSEFSKFIQLVSFNPHNPDEQDYAVDIIAERFRSHCSGIGFLLDGYKHPSIRPALFLLDHKVGERGERIGRTGKKYLCKSLLIFKSGKHHWRR